MLNSQQSVKASVLYAGPLTSDVLCIKMVLLEPAVQILIRRSAQKHASRGQRHINSNFYYYPTVKIEESWCTAWRVNQSFCGRWRCRAAKGAWSSKMLNSSSGSVSNQVLFTSHIMLKNRRNSHTEHVNLSPLAKGDLFVWKESNPFRGPILRACSSEDEGKKPACNFSQKKYSQDLGKMREEAVNQCHSKTSRRFFFFPRRLQ